MNPAQSELDQLATLQARADKIASDAARWPQLLNQARANLAAAQATFVAALDAKAAAAVSDADSNVRALVPACAALDAAGGPVALSRRVLTSLEAFALLSTGYRKRLEALDRLVLRVRELCAKLTAEAVRAGADPRQLLGLNMPPDMQRAHEVLGRIEREAQSVRVALGYVSSPVGHAPRSFDELVGVLSAPLPVLPAT